MKLEDHQQALDEHLRNLNKAIDHGVEENQRNIAYNVSQGAVELFALHLHTLHLIEGSGDQWDHRFFKSRRKIAEKVPFDFPDKARILLLLETIELERNQLCYGKRKSPGKIEEFITYFRELQKIIVPRLTHEK